MTPTKSGPARLIGILSGTVLLVLSAPTTSQAQTSPAIPVVDCFTGASIFNTGMTDNSGIIYWTVKRTTENVQNNTNNAYYMNPTFRDTTAYPPPPGPWQPTSVVLNRPGWHVPTGGALWISHATDGVHGPLNETYLEDFYYRFVFVIDNAVNLESFKPQMSFYADDTIYDIYVNGQRVVPRWIESIGDYNPWHVQSFMTGQGASYKFDSTWWQHGQNELIVHIRSIGTVQGFLAEFTSESLCEPSLTLRKTVNGGTMTPADFTLVASGPAQTIQGKSGNPAVTSVVVEPGTYALSEQPAPAQVGYAQDITCNIETALQGGGTSSSTVTGTSVSLTPYDTAVCEFVNTYIPPTSLTLKKVVQNTRVGTLTPDRFTLRASGPTSFSGRHGSPAVTLVEVEPGVYTLSEDPVNGYKAAGTFVCEELSGASIPVSPSNQITVDRGQKITCTITNVDMAAELTLSKEVINDSGGTASPSDFTLIAGSGTAEYRFAHGQTQSVPVGTYTLSEEGPAGYGASLFTCTLNGVTTVSNTITLADNDVASCTVTNNDIAIEKSLTAESGSLPGVAEPGEILTYTVTLTNDGTANALYNLVDNLDTNLTYVPGSAGGVATGMEPVSTRPLKWNGLVLPPGTSTVTYQARVSAVLPQGKARITNCIGTVCTETVASGWVSISKKLIGESGGNQPDLAEPGEILTYEVTLTNEGEAPAIFDLGDVPSDYSTYVPGSTRGTAGAAEPEGPIPLVWRNIPVHPGQPVTVVYDVRVADVLPPGTASLRNIAYSPRVFEAELEEQGGGDGSGSGGRGDGGSQQRYPGADYCNRAGAGCLDFETLNISFAKVAHMPTADRGMNLPFSIEVTNHASAPVQNVVVTDVMPAGFTFVEGSATIDGKPVTPIVNGRSVQITIARLEPRSTTTVDLQMRAQPSLKPGSYSNRAGLRDPSGREIVGTSAAFEISVEPMFDCGDIIGKVFDDENRNGYHDDGEGGISGARVASPEGVQVVTDSHGRFHIPCADLPDSRIGRNFILKLDPRSLPSGYRIISENPRVVRLTAGKLTSIDFAASVTRVVRVDVNDSAFETGSVTLSPRWEQTIPELIAMLETEPSVLRIVYHGQAGNGAGHQRLRELRRLIIDHWTQKSSRYKLDIEIIVISGGAMRFPEASPPIVFQPN